MIINNHEEIRRLYPQVAIITEDNAYDADNNIVELGEFSLDSDGNCFNKYLDDMVEGKYVPDTSAEQALVDTKLAIELKEARTKAVATLRGEVDGLVYDGNEPSQGRMARAIQTLVDGETIPWTMYDNTTEILTKIELGKALRACGMLQSQLWVTNSIEEIELIVGADAVWFEKYKEY